MKSHQFNTQIVAIRDYFNLDLKEHDVKKLQRILSSVPPKIIKTEVPVKSKEGVTHVINKYIPIVTNADAQKLVDSSTFSLEQELINVCKYYGVSYKQVKSGNRISIDITRAKAHFCRQVMIANPRLKLIDLGAFLRIGHYSVYHLLYKSKVDCAIPPIEKRRIFISKIYLPVNAGVENTVADNQ